MSFLLNWFWRSLEWLNLKNKEGTVVFLGLDNAGKTTLMHMLRDNQLVQHTPTQKPTMEIFTLGNLNFKLFDLGGHKIARRLWQDYMHDVQGIVFLVDAAEEARFDEAKTELDVILSEPALANVPVVVLGNKIDAPGAYNEQALGARLGLTQALAGKENSKETLAAGFRPVELFMCSVVKRQGYREAFHWMAGFI